MSLPDVLDNTIPHLPAALCADLIADDWFHSPGNTCAEASAKAVCALCPESTGCLTYALTYPMHATHGIWGGLTAQERRRILRNGAA